MKRYASETTVSPEKSRGEIERTLSAFGATGFAYGWQGARALIAFEFAGRRMQFMLTLPTKDDEMRDTMGRLLPNQKAALEREQRRRWRSLALSIKSKLVAVQDDISTVEYEFMAHIVMPNGQTVGDWMAPQIDRAYQLHTMPPLLIGAPTQEAP